MKVKIVYIALFFASCIDPYNSEDYGSVKTVVVDGMITDTSEYQSLTLSWSNSIKDPVQHGLSDASVTVVDQEGKVFKFTESGIKKGVYEGNIPFSSLTVGNAFTLNFSTSEGKTYSSTLEEMLPCPAVDSVYYRVNNNYYETGSNYQERGVEFFLDIKADKKFGQYYRWKLDETYEYHATWPIETYWEGKWVTLPIASYKYFYCYITRPIGQIFTTTTAQLDENVILKYPLHFVSNQSQRLYFRYSLLVNQMSVSKGVYQFWEDLKANNQTSGGLYDSQPLRVKGNIICISDPNEEVLGYFGVSSIATKRIFITRNDLVGELIYDPDIFCKQWKPSRLDFITNSDLSTWPIYMAPPPTEDDSGLWYATQECLDCRKNGGSTELPEFWRNN